MNQQFRLLSIGLALCGLVADADDWPRFRGPAGSGIAADSESLPSKWSPTTNVAWKVPLPGPGASSPIIVGHKVLVTCYSGYGVDRETPGEIENLVRNLVCIDVRTADKLWQKNVPTVQNPDPVGSVRFSPHALW